MAWQKGQSGNLAGGKRPKIVTQQVIAALNEAITKGGPNKLRLLVEKLIEMAAGGDMAAMREVFDRAEGKPIQESSVTIDDKRDIPEFSDQELMEMLRDKEAHAKGNGAVH
jgi:ribosomal protein L17